MAALALVKTDRPAHPVQPVPLPDTGLADLAKAARIGDHSERIYAAFLAMREFILHPRSVAYTNPYTGVSMHYHMKPGQYRELILEGTELIDLVEGS